MFYRLQNARRAIMAWLEIFHLVFTKIPHKTLRTQTSTDRRTILLSLFFFLGRMKLQSVQLSANTTGSPRHVEDLPTIEAGPHRLNRAPTFRPRRGYVTTPRQESDFFLVSNLLFSSILFLFARRCRLIDTLLARYGASYSLLSSLFSCGTA